MNQSIKQKPHPYNAMVAAAAFKSEVQRLSRARVVYLGHIMCSRHPDI